jgi:RecA-family ATPase
MFSGDGGTGKSYLGHQLTIARALVRKWIGLEVVPGRTLYLSREDNMKEMKRREYGILQFYDACWGDLGDNVNLVDFVGEDSND